MMGIWGTPKSHCEVEKGINCKLRGVVVWAPIWNHVVCNSVGPWPKTEGMIELEPSAHCQAHEHYILFYYYCFFLNKRIADVYMHNMYICIYTKPSHHQQLSVTFNFVALIAWPGSLRVFCDDGSKVWYSGQDQWCHGGWKVGMPTKQPWLFGFYQGWNNISGQGWEHVIIDPVMNQPGFHGM